MVFDDSTDSETQPHLLFQETSSELKEIANTFDKVIAGFMTAEQVQASSLFESVTDLLKTAKESLSSSRTAKLWLQYMEMVDILCDFIKTERTGNWLLHLSVFRSMLPFLASSGHQLYTKSAYLYLQIMSKLPETNSRVHQYFLNEYHVSPTI